jgi:hypothetical protein
VLPCCTVVSMRYALVLALTTGCLAALAPRTVEACACCGSAQTAKIAGWAASGRALAIHRRIDATCNLQQRLEIWELGESTPSRCYDAYGEDPASPVRCGSIEGIDRNEGILQKPAPLPLPPGFEQPASAVAGRYVMFWGAYDDETEAYDLTLEVYVPGGKSGRFHSIDMSAYRDSMRDETVPTELSVWPAPAGGWAVLLLEHGRYDDEEVAVVWVKLPGHFDRSVVQGTGGEAGLQPPPELPDPERDDPRHQAARLMARARVYERIGDPDMAYSLYQSATSSDPGFTMAWIETARLAIVKSRPEQGLAILKRVARLPCPTCKTQLRTALDRPGFADVRERLGLATLGGQR